MAIAWRRVCIVVCVCRAVLEADVKRKIFTALNSNENESCSQVAAASGERGIACYGGALAPVW